MLNETEFASLEEYTAYRVKKDLNMTMDQAAEKIMREVQSELMPLDVARYGELPKLLRDA